MTKEFSQLCVWPGTNLGDGTSEDFEAWVSEAFNGTRVKFSEVVETLLDRDVNGDPVEGTGGRTDMLFYVHSEDVEKFALRRVAYGIRWWEDAISQSSHLYDDNVLSKYPDTWVAEKAS